MVAYLARQLAKFFIEKEYLDECEAAYVSLVQSL